MCWILPLSVRVFTGVRVLGAEEGQQGGLVRGLHRLVDQAQRDRVEVLPDGGRHEADERLRLGVRDALVPALDERAVGVPRAERGVRRAPGLGHVGVAVGRAPGQRRLAELVGHVVDALDALRGLVARA